MICTIKVIRYLETEKSTTGHLYLNGKKIGYTLELPWKDNQNEISRIPEGVYSAFIRKASTSKWNYDIIQLRNVPNRTDVQIHRGNIPKHTIGCIIPGLYRALDEVSFSKKALDKIMAKARNRNIQVIILNFIKK